MAATEKLIKEDVLLPGKGSCPGCGAAIAFRWLVNTLGRKTIIVWAPGCNPGMIYAGKGVYPIGGSLFENAASYASGIREGLDVMGKKDWNVATFIGDGGTVDIGLQALSGAAERGHSIIYVCYDNEAYMNTGIQRSGSTPFGAWTSTTPVGAVVKGKTEHRKDMPAIVVASQAAYVSTASPSYLLDYLRKVKKAEEITRRREGFAYIHVSAPCPVGWRFPSKDTIKIGRLEVETGLWQLYEIYQGKLQITHKVRKRKPVMEFCAPQGRFRHLSEEQIDELQKYTDRKCEQLGIP